MLEALYLSVALTQTQPFDLSAEVDVELVLAVDVSQSMDADEAAIQRDGYAAALTSDEFLRAVEGGPLGRIAVTYLEWAGVGEQYVVADWAVVQDAATAASFARAVQSGAHHTSQRTSIADALDYAAQSIESNAFQGLRKVIDVSGDGPNNQGGSVTDVRDRLVAQGYTINGLPLMIKDTSKAWPAMPHLHHYYEDCVIGGPGAFVEPVRSRAGFPDAIRKKLVQEVARVSPERLPVTRVLVREKIRCHMFD